MLMPTYICITPDTPGIFLSTNLVDGGLQPITHKYLNPRYPNAHTPLEAKPIGYGYQIRARVMLLGRQLHCFVMDDNGERRATQRLRIIVGFNHYFLFGSVGRVKVP